MTHVSVVRPAPIATPRGSRWAAGLALRLQDLLRSGFALLQARRHLRSRAEEATAVRRLADEMRVQDPRFAADLYAAADRHELV